MREEREVEKEGRRRALLLANSSQTNPNMRRGTDAEAKCGATRQGQDSILCLIWAKNESMLLDVRKNLENSEFSPNLGFMAPLASAGSESFLSTAWLLVLIFGAFWTLFLLGYVQFHLYRGLGLWFRAYRALELAIIVSKFRFFSHFGLSCWPSCFFSFASISLNHS